MRLQFYPQLIPVIPILSTCDKKENSLTLTAIFFFNIKQNVIEVLKNETTKTTQQNIAGLQEWE